jgi:PPOX class probable F420-dependent enzyme
MGVRLTEAEIDDFLASGHTLIVSTVRKSGEPFTTPVWYVWMDGSFWVRTPAKSAKIQHIRRDPRVCCLVEDGDKWIDLKAVIAPCDAEIVEDEAQIAKAQAAIDAKYAAFRLDNSALPDVSRKHYAQPAFIRLAPRPGEMRTWFNRKLRLADPA